MKESFVGEQLKNQGLDYVHPSHSLELELVRHVADGNYEEALAVMQRFALMERPQLAYNEIRSVKNQLIALCTVLTRAAIKGGVLTEDAFDMSDIVIRTVETLDTVKELKAYELDMIRIFTELVRQSMANQYPYPVSDMVTYIYKNITAKITVSDLSRVTHLSADYVSRIFKKEVGCSITDYVQMKKIDASKKFLLYKDMSITDIAAIFNFCNHGYYSKVFKKYTGMTPVHFIRANKHKQAE